MEKAKKTGRLKAKPGELATMLVTEIHGVGR